MFIPDLEAVISAQKSQKTNWVQQNPGFHTDILSRFFAVVPKEAVILAEHSTVYSYVTHFHNRGLTSKLIVSLLRYWYRKKVHKRLISTANATLIYLLKTYSPINRTGSPQGFSPVQILHMSHKKSI